VVNNQKNENQTPLSLNFENIYLNEKNFDKKNTPISIDLR
jgi:hypothetical protein